MEVPPLPYKNTSKVTETQRKRIAQGRLTGEPSKKTAAATGLKTGTVNHVALDPRTKVLMADLKREHEKTLRLGFARALRTIDHYIGDGRTRSKEDASIALRASSQMMNVITAGESKLDADKATAGDFTFQELMESYLDLKRARG